MNKNLEDLLEIILQLKAKYNLPWQSIPYIGDIQNNDRLQFNLGFRKNYNINLNVFFKDGLFYFTYLDERGGIEIICKTRIYTEVLYQVLIKILDEEARKGKKLPYIENEDGTRKVLSNIITENKAIYIKKMIELLNNINPEFGIRYKKEN